MLPFIWKHTTHHIETQCLYWPYQLFILQTLFILNHWIVPTIFQGSSETSIYVLGFFGPFHMTFWASSRSNTIFWRHIYSWYWIHVLLCIRSIILNLLGWVFCHLDCLHVLWFSESTLHISCIYVSSTDLLGHWMNVWTYIWFWLSDANYSHFLYFPSFPIGFLGNMSISTDATYWSDHLYWNVDYQCPGWNCPKGHLFVTRNGEWNTDLLMIWEAFWLQYHYIESANNYPCDW